MYIHMLMANHPTSGNQIIYAYRSKDMAEIDRAMLEKEGVESTNFTVEEVFLVEE